MAEARDPRIDERESCLALSRRDLLRTLGAGALAASVPLIGRAALAALSGGAGVRRGRGQCRRTRHRRG
jgi:hypothetical protein